jgi:hypothetical protein
MGLFGWMLLRTILFSIIGNSFYKWFSKTKMGIWFDKKMEKIMSKVTSNVEALEILDDNENGRSPNGARDNTDE